MQPICDNTDVARAYHVADLAERGLDTFEIALMLTAISFEERVKTTEELEMAADLESPEVAKAYGFPPERPAEPHTDNPDLPF